MNIVFYNVDKDVSTETLQDMHTERMKGNLIFVCSRKPYYQIYSQYFRYANGVISNDYNYVQMGCCEVMRDVHYQMDDINRLYLKLHPYATMIMHGVKDSYIYKDDLSLNAYRLVPYTKQTVYSFSVYLKDRKCLKEVKELSESEYDLQRVNELLFELNKKCSSLLLSCRQVCDYFGITDMEIR